MAGKVFYTLAEVTDINTGVALTETSLADINSTFMDTNIGTGNFGGIVSTSQNINTAGTYVIYGKSFAFDGVGRWDLTTNGVNVYLINCTIDLTGVVNAGTSGVKPFNYQTATNNTGFVLSNQGNSRVLNRTNSNATSRTVNAYGCTFTQNKSAANARVNLGLNDVRDCSFINITDGALRYYPAAQASLPASPTEGTDGARAGRWLRNTFDNSQQGVNNFINNHSATIDISGSEFIASAFLTNDGAGISTNSYSSPLVFSAGEDRYYGIGNAGTNHGILSINPITRVPTIDRDNAVYYNVGGSALNALVIEATEYNPTFTSNTTPSAGIIAYVNTNQTFGTAGNTFTLQNPSATATTREYITGSDGRLNGVTNAIQLSTGSAYTDGDSLIIPTVRMVGLSGTQTTSKSTPTLFTTSFDIRALQHEAPNGTGLKTFNISPTENLTPNGTAVLDEDAWNTKLSLSTDFLAVANPTIASMTTFLNGVVNITTPITAQRIHDATHVSWVDRDITAYPDTNSAPNTLTMALNVEVRNTNLGTSPWTITGSNLVIEGSEYNTHTDGSAIHILNIPANSFDLNNLNFSGFVTAGTFRDLGNTWTGGALDGNIISHSAGNVTVTGGMDLSDLTSSVPITLIGIPGTNFTAPTDLTNITIESPPFAFTIGPEVDASGNALYDGYFGVYNNTTNAVVHTSKRFTSGNALPAGTDFDITDITNTYTAYVGRDNTLATGYMTTTHSGLQGNSVDETRRFGVAEIVSVLYQSNTDGATTVVIKENKTSLVTVPSITNSSVNIAITGANTDEKTGAETLAILLFATNDQDYFDVMLENGLTKDVIEPSSSISTNIDNQYVSLSSSISSQQLITAVGTMSDNNDWPLSGTITGTVNAVLSAQNPAGITITEVETGVDNVLDTNTNLEKIRRGVGYTIGELDDLSINESYSKTGNTEDNL